MLVRQSPARPLALASALLLAGLVPATAPPSALAMRSPVSREVGVITRDARRDFQVETRSAYTTLRSASASFSTALRSGDEAVADAVAGYAGALAQYLRVLRLEAEGASSAVADGVAQAIVDLDAVDHRDTLAGAGGLLDRFGDQLQRDLDRAHRRAVGHTRRFLAAVERATGRDARTGFHIRRPEFAPAPAPRDGGALTPGQRPLRLDMYVTVRLATVGTVITVAGSAAPELDGQFDVRLINPAHVAVGEFLADGGVAVEDDGSWVVSDVLGAPDGGVPFPPGNRTLQFGVEPFDGGLAGTQPGRLVQAGVIGIP